jgi:cell division protein FtsW
MRLAVTILVFCVAALLALGMVMLYSSSMMQKGAQFLVMQLLWGGLGLACGVAAMLMDYRWLKKAAWPLLGLSVLLLALVLEHHVAPKINGARRWLVMGVFRFQPSELAKLALIVMLAWYGERYQRQMPGWKRGVLLPGCFIALVLGLVFIEPDRGTTVLLAGVSGTMLLLAGVQWRFIVPPVILGLTALGLSLRHDHMRSARIFGWLYLEEHKSGVGYQAYQAMLALGAGGWTGLGLGNGRQKYGFVPEHHTDFIFSMIGEELGFIATLLVVLAFVAILISGIYIALHAPDTFGLLLGSGIAFLIGLQAFINIGVVTSVLPNKGLPLPFISYGGSNLLMMLTSVGVLLSIARQGHGADPMGEGEAQREHLPVRRRRRNPFQTAESARRASQLVQRVFAPMPP